MGDFSRVSNFNPQANFQFVRIGADCPVLEIELNEMQLITEQRLKDLATTFIGDGVVGTGKYTYQGGTLTITDEKALLKGNTIDITTLKLALGEGEKAYLQLWAEEVTYQDTLKYMGNVQEERTVENKILDTNIGKETSRRMQLLYDLVKDPNSRRDKNPITLELGTVTNGKFNLLTNILKSYVAKFNIDKFKLEANQQEFQTTGAYQTGVNAMTVFVDGVLQLEGEDEDYTEVNNNTVKFNAPVPKGSEVILKYTHLKIVS